MKFLLLGNSLAQSLYFSPSLPSPYISVCLYYEDYLDAVPQQEVLVLAVVGRLFGNVAGLENNNNNNKKNDNDESRNLFPV